MTVDTKTITLLHREVASLDAHQADQASVVYRRLREAILDGQIPSGATMDGSALAAGYKVNSCVIHAAWKGLIRGGLVTGGREVVRVIAPTGRTPGQAQGPVTSETLYNAFGETKTLAQWAADERCRVPYRTLRTRVLTCDWDIERAITIPLDTLRSLL
ncbi:hypothetical protein AB0M32_17345 [Streptomyces sp. NPDC051985]|uniref:hypothetical protein n=1 Tax=Streptomyces sp. NPDC051985 TaxID=3155807 RepID=UPI003437003B